MFWGTFAEIAPSCLVVLLTCGYPLWGDRRYRQGRFDASLELEAKHRIEDNRRQGPRHAAPPARGEGARRAATISRSDMEDWFKSRWPVTTARHCTTATDLAPVFIPRPGARVPLRPQAGRDSMDGTIIGGVRPVTTDTGEFRAVIEQHTDKYVEDLQRSEAAFRGDMQRSFRGELTT